MIPNLNPWVNRYLRQPITDSDSGPPVNKACLRPSAASHGIPALASGPTIPRASPRWPEEERCPRSRSDGSVQRSSRRSFLVDGSSQTHPTVAGSPCLSIASAAPATPGEPGPGAQPLVGVAGADCSARGPGQRPVGLRASARARYLCTSSRESVARLPAVVLHYDAHACIAICLELLCTGAHRDGAARAAGDEVRALRRR